jgi:hypothetical protein
MLTWKVLCMQIVYDVAVGLNCTEKEYWERQTDVGASSESERGYCSSPEQISEGLDAGATQLTRLGCHHAIQNTWR